MAEIRVIIYLEDLGPVDELSKKELEYETGVADRLDSHGEQP